MNILFLDFDGPLIPTCMPQPPLPEELQAINRAKGTLLLTDWQMEVFTVSALNHLAQNSKFQVVVSSSWREHFSKEEIITIFKANSLRLWDKLHADWKTGSINSSRAMQIRMWLEEHEGEYQDFVVLDDEVSGYTVLKDKFFKKHRYIVSEEIGFTVNQTISLKERVDKWK